MVRGTPSLSLSEEEDVERSREQMPKNQWKQPRSFPEGRKERGNCFYGPAPHQCQASASALNFGDRFEQKHCGMEANFTLLRDLVSEVGDLASDRSLL